MKKIDLLISIGQNIKSIRVEKKISQAELAALCNYEKSNMCRIESGKTNLTVGTLLTIAEALDVGIIDLLTIKGATL